MAAGVRTRKRRCLAETDNHLEPSPDSSADSLLSEAISKGRQAEVASLLESSFDQISTKTLVGAVFQASENGHKRLLQHLIRHGVDINSRNNNGYTALAVAAEHGYVDIVRLLVKNGADINSKTKSEKTALILAAEKACFLPVIEFLVSDTRTDVNIQDRDGRTALMVSIQMCDLAAMRVLLSHKEVQLALKDKKGRRLFDIAIEHGVAEEFSTLQECIGSVYLNPIIIAVVKGDVRLLREFIDSDYYDIDHTDMAGYTPLMLTLKSATDNSSTDIILTLLISGANANSVYTGRPESTPLMYAAESGNLNAVKLLVEYGANVNAQTPMFKFSALMVAVQNGFSDIVELLIEKNADLHLKDFNDYTALTLAFKANQIHCAAILLQHGADIVGEDLIRAACMEIDPVLYEIYSSITTKIAASEVSFMLIERCLSSKNYGLVESLLDHSPGIQRHFKNLLLKAITRDDKMAKLLLDRGAGVNSIDAFGHTALMKAACSDNRVMVELLLEGGARMNSHCEGSTALVFAIGKHALNGLDALLEGGVDVNFVPKHSLACVPLHRSISLRSNDITEILISHGADVNIVDKEGQSALLLAMKLKSFHVIDLLIRGGVNLDRQQACGSIPLHIALKNHDFKMAEVLLRGGANVNVADSKGTTALIICSQICTTDFMSLLLKSGADVNASDETGSVALHYAVKHSITSSDKAELLLKSGADVNRKDNEGQTPFMIASRCCNSSVLRSLLEHGADVNAQDKRGASALIDASFASSWQVEFLIDSGADMNVQNSEGYTPLMIAAEESNDLAMRALLNAGANVRLLENKNYNVLSVALAVYNRCRFCFGDDFKCEHLLCIEMLINAGAEPDMSNQCTLALYKAVICNKMKLVQLLVGCGIPPVELPRDCEDLLSCSLPQKFFTSICGVPCHRPLLQEFLHALGISIHARSPLSTAIFCKNAAICEFFIKNWYFNQYDMTRLSLNFLNSHVANAGGTRLAAVCEGVFSKPFSLTTQSFVAVGESVGFDRHRIERIRALPIPLVLQEKLLYSDAKNDVIGTDSQEVVNFMLPRHLY